MKKSRVITVFPKGTIVKYDGIPCELLEDTTYYSATFQKVAEDKIEDRIKSNMTREQYDKNS